MLFQQTKKDGINVNVGDIMDTWILQKRYPLVMVRRDYKHKTATLTQSVFINEYATANSHLLPYNHTWTIPLTFTTKQDQKFENPNFLLFDHNLRELRIPTCQVPNNDEWIVANVGYSYYRVNYDDNNWDLLIKQVKDDAKVIPEGDVFRLVSDSKMLCFNGDVKCTVFLGLCQYIKQDMPDSMLECSKGLLLLGDVMTNTRLYSKITKYVEHFTRDIDMSLKTNTKSTYTFEDILRNLACSFGIKKCVEQASKVFSDAVTRNNTELISSSPRSVRLPLFCFAIHYGNATNWLLASRWLKQQNIDEDLRKDMNRALACTPDIDRLKQYTSELYTTTNRSQDDLIEMVETVAISSDGQKVVWNALRENWRNIYYKYGTDILNRLIRAATKFIRSEEEIDSIQEFSDKLLTRGLLFNTTSTWRKATEDSTKNMRMVKRMEEYLESWIDRNILQHD